MTTIAERNQNLIQNGSIIKGLLVVSAPIAMASLFRTFYNLIDAFFVGQISSTHLAAISFSFSAIFLFYSFSNGIRVGTVALISRAVGAKNFHKASDIFTVSLVIAFIISLVLILVGFLVTPHTLKFMASSTNDPYFIKLTIDYTKIILLTLPVVYIFAIFQAQKQAIGDTTTPVKLQIISFFINILLDYLFIIVLKKGVVGAGLATLISLYALLPLIIKDLRKKEQVIFDLRNLRLDKFDFYEFFKIVIPAAISDLLLGLTFLILNMNAAEFGTQIIAGVSTGNRYNQLIQIPIISLGMTITTYIGQLYGSRNIPRAKEAYLKSLFLMVVIGTSLWLIVFILREFLVGLLFKTNDMEAYYFTIKYTVLITFSAIFFGMLQVNLSVLNGFGLANITMFINIFRMWILRIPLFYLLKPYFGADALWIAMISSILIIFVISEFITLKQFSRKSVELEGEVMNVKNAPI